MDLIRYGTMDNKIMSDSARCIVDVARRCSIYLRNKEKARNLLFHIVNNKKVQGRLFDAYKDAEVHGGFHVQWSGGEIVCLRICVIFTFVYSGALRYDFAVSPKRSGNAGIIHEVYQSMIILEALDIAFMDEFRSRARKAIQDKLRWCIDYDISKGNETIIDIKNYLINKFGAKRLENLNEPSSCLVFIPFLSFFL